MNLNSPAHTVADWDPPFPADGLPRLSKTSDIAFLLWASFADDKIKNVRYFFMLAIKNELTDRILTRATGGKVKPWPGDTFTADQDEMRALLGKSGVLLLARFLTHGKALPMAWALGTSLYSTRHAWGITGFGLLGSSIAILSIKRRVCFSISRINGLTRFQEWEGSIFPYEVR